MTNNAPQSPSFYLVVLRLWFFLILAMVIMVVMFPTRLQLCGEANTTTANKFTLRDFIVLLGANGVAGAFLMKLRSRLLFVLATIVALIAIDWLVAQLFCIELNFGVPQRCR